MRTSTNRVVVGLDNGGKVNNATVLESSGRFLVDGLIESPSLVREGPDIAIDALARTSTTSWHLLARQRPLSSRLGWILPAQPARRE